MEATIPITPIIGPTISTNQDLDNSEIDNNTTDPTPITPDGDDNPYPIILTGETSLWDEEYDLGLMELPWVADQTEVLTPDSLESLGELLGLEDLVMIEESMELDFSLFSENLEPLDTVPVKPINEPTSDPYVESYYQDMIYQDVLKDWMLIPMS